MLERDGKSDPALRRRKSQGRALALAGIAGAIVAIASPRIAMFSEAAAEEIPCVGNIIYGDGTRVIRGADNDVGQVQAQPCAADPNHFVVTGSQGEGSVPLPYVISGNADVDVAPCSLPGGNDLPGATIVIRYEATGYDGKPQRLAETFTLGDDRDAPALDVHSIPPKGSKVRAGDKIVVKINADEGFGDGRGSWQTGVQSIQLLADDGKVEPDFTEPGMLPKACANKSWKRTLETTYKVPKNPPPIVHLTAIAADFAGNENFKTAEFPVGDWYGTFKWSAHQEVPTGPQDWKGSADLVLTEDGKGGLTGRLKGSQAQKLELAKCHAETHGTLTADLTGTITGKKITVNAPKGSTDWPAITACREGGTAGTGGTIFNYPHVDEALRELAPDGEDAFLFDRQWTIGDRAYPVTLHYTVRLARAK